MAEPDVLRLMVFAFGSPVVIVLGLRSEWQQRADRAAWRASRAAEEQANQAQAGGRRGPASRCAMPWSRSIASGPGWRRWHRPSPSP